MLQLEYQRRWIGGIYLNSVGRWSWYGAYRMTEPWSDRMFVEVGAVTGYGPHVVRSIRFGLELNKHLDVVALPGFAHARSLKISTPVSVLAIIVKF